jgi:hypothetical protein
MAKLTKKQLSRIEYALRNLERANNYLMQENIVIAHKDNIASTTLHYSRNDGKCLYEVEKNYGSDLTGLFNGISELKAIINSQFTS